MRRAWKVSGIVPGAIAFAALVAAGGAAADPTDRESREQQMLERTRQALHDSQAANDELARAKSEAEQKLKALNDDLAAARKQSRSAQSTQGSLRSQLQAATTAQDALRRELEGKSHQLEDLEGRQHELQTRLVQSESDLKQAQQELSVTKVEVASCDNKNLKLYTYSQDILEQYHRKGVWAALAQKEPVTGIEQVHIDNVLQEYQQKLAAQKLASPAPAPR